jgi:hypothetical protein
MTLRLQDLIDPSPSNLDTSSDLQTRLLVKVYLSSLLIIGKRRQSDTSAQRGNRVSKQLYFFDLINLP